MQMNSCRAALKEKCKVERGNLLARLLARLFALVNTESVEIGFQMSLMESWNVNVPYISQAVRATQSSGRADHAKRPS
jgi:hypothetical protein